MGLDEYGMQLAQSASIMSKDPSTKVGACIMDLCGRVVSMGRNGAPIGADDEYWLEGPRDRKIAITIHAELNAILNARSSVKGCTAYVTMAPCSHCCSVLAQSGIKRVVCMPPKPAWFKSAEIGRQMLVELGVEVVWLG